MSNISEIYDEENDITIRLVFICKCGIVTKMLNEEAHGCPHCDSVCKITNCQNCKMINEWKDDANL